MIPVPQVILGEKDDEDHLVFLIADVSDKGIGAAIFMAISKSILHSFAGVIVYITGHLQKTYM